MSTALRVLGWILVFLAGVVLARDVIAIVQGQPVSFAPLGGLWYAIDSGSINAFQAGVERYLSVWLWDAVIAQVLLWPAVLVLGVPGALLVWLGRRRAQRRNRLFRR